MTIGYGVVWAGVAFALASIGLYLLSGKFPALQRWARVSFVGLFAAIVAAEGLLIYALLTGRYDLQYVFSFSEESLTPLFKVASAWAGQEGSFLLWALWLGIYGLFLMRTAGGYERWVMVVYGGVLLMLMAILAFQSPFAPLPKPNPVPPVWPPRDGFGLNPVLENPWMKIHPPIIFAGFAALTVPFAYAIAALWRDEYHEFAVRVRPWAIYSATMLGFGLALGGYWAYETLGWGGFWAWDPVENSSYFPWLFMAAGMHGLLLQINRGRMVRWNPLLLALPHLLFLYGTFLTRSGALAEVSVHSFVNMETNALKILLGMLMGSALLTLGLWAWRYRQMPLPAPNQTRGISREAAVRWGILLLCISALISLIGTSWPLITKAVGQQMEALKPEFYNQVHIPWIVVTAVVLAAAPLLTWRGMSIDQALERLTKSWLAAVATGFVLFFLGFREPITLLICTLIAFTAYANAGAILRRMRTSRLTLGGFITHVGLAIAILGLILSYAYERKERVVIPQGQDTFAMGYKWRYLGMTGNERFPGDPLADKFNRVRIEIASHDQKFVVEPRFYQDQRRETGNNVVWPAILRWWDHDLYVSFFAPPQIDVSPLTLGLHEGEKGTVEGYTVEFLGFETGGAMGAEGFRAIAKARVSHPNWEKPVEVEPFRMITSSGVVPIPVPLPDGAQLLIGQMDVNQRLVQFQMVMVPNKPETTPRWVVPLEVYYKPFTILVWLGPPLTLLGGLLATLRRARDVRYGVARTTAEPFPTPAPRAVKPRGRKPRPVKEPVVAHTETHSSG